ncbi:MAG: DUF4157 domain-containing protein [Coleofasciculus sp. C1-SOL-03]|uniref:eCIS core domain-containing protein n=1 Tax=Coleofasciculus sp. C1-SOL-03 TaxID=3069522 RepID=UPI0032FED650
MYKPLQKKNSSWTPTTAQKKTKSPSKLGHFSIQPKPNKKSSQSPEIGEYSRDSADRLTANVMRSLEAKGSQETETPTVQPQSESRISVADVVGQRTPTLTPHTLSPLQRKLTVGQPGDKYEQEADTVAAKVVEQINSPTSQQPVQGKVEPVVEPTVMRDGGVGGGAVDDSVEQSIQQAQGGGQGLSEDVREPMEQAFGADFSGVRVHNNSNADQLNRSLNARAFTTGSDIFFKQGEYNPGSRDGQELLAHELTHVVQQSGSQLQTKQTGSVELMRSLEDKGSQETETPTVQRQSESGGSAIQPGKIELRYTPVGGTFGMAHHAFVVVSDPVATNEQGQPIESVRETYYRGGPSGGGSGSSSSSASSSDSSRSSSGSSQSSGSSDSSNSSETEGGNSGFWGYIATEYGEYVPGTIDWTTSPSGTINAAPSLELSSVQACDNYRDSLAGTMDRIETSQIRYFPLGPNSNSTAHQGIRDAGLGNPAPPVRAPGWDQSI